MFSYTHTDIAVRYQRMRGRNVFYPMGWDDNGLPTERRVQNYYHVRCDPNAPYEPGLRLEPASAKDRKDPPRSLSRSNFIEACTEVTREDEKSYKELWHRLGISVDWRLEYQTIDEHCRRIAQLSFRELFEKGEVYSSEAPTMWDADFQTRDRPGGGRGPQRSPAPSTTSSSASRAAGASRSRRRGPSCWPPASASPPIRATRATRGSSASAR